MSPPRASRRQPTWTRSDLPRPTWDPHAENAAASRATVALRSTTGRSRVRGRSAPRQPHSTRPPARLSVSLPGPRRQPRVGAARRRWALVRFSVRLDGQPPGDAHGVDVDAAGEGTIAEPRMYQLVRQRARSCRARLRDHFPRPRRTRLRLHVRLIPRPHTRKSVSSERGLLPRESYVWGLGCTPSTSEDRSAHR